MITPPPPWAQPDYAHHAILQAQAGINQPIYSLSGVKSRMTLTIDEVENGYILTIGDKTYIISGADELADKVKLAMVGKAINNR
jgi:hypothetical protein